MSILKAIAADNFIAVNRALAHQFGLDEAIMLGELASQHNYYDSEDKLTEDGFFFSTVEKVERNTTLSKHRQGKALRNLQDAGLLAIEYRGIPRKRYVKLDAEKLVEVFAHLQAKISPTSGQKIRPLAGENFARNKNIEENTYENREERDARKRARFTPPTVDEVEAYCRERSNTVDAEQFCDFYAAKGWRVGSQPMRDWKAAVRTWEKRQAEESADTFSEQFKAANRERSQQIQSEQQAYREQIEKWRAEQAANPMSEEQRQEIADLKARLARQAKRATA